MLYLAEYNGRPKAVRSERSTHKMPSAACEGRALLASAVAPDFGASSKLRGAKMRLRSSETTTWHSDSAFIGRPLLDSISKAT